jgi:signal transduction histidine kinase
MSDDQTSELTEDQLHLAFEGSEFHHRKEYVTRAIYFAAVFSVMGVVLDIFVNPTHLLSFFVCRCSIAVLLLLTLVPLGMNPSPPMLRLLSHWVVTLPMLAIAFIFVRLNDGESSYYAGLNLVLVGASLILRWRFIDSVINASQCLIAFLVFVPLLPGDATVIFTHAFFILVTAVFACAGTFFYNKLRFQEFKLRHELDQNSIVLEKRNKELRKLDETKTRFFANISHELRTPLTLILGPVEQLKNNRALLADPGVKQTVETLSQNGFRLLRLINDLLDLVRLDTGDVPMRPENIELPKFLDSLGISLRPMADTQHISLSVESDLPDHPVVRYDRDSLEKIILNLSINALKFTPAGGKVGLRLHEEDDHFILRVFDTGKGMTKEDLKQIFGRFWQADSSSKRKARGTGIGLALVKSLTDRLGGEIDVKSEPGEGTCFTIRFPLNLPTDQEIAVEVLDGSSPASDEFDALHEKARLAAANPDQHQTARAAIQNPTTRSSKGKARVLIVDDEPGMRSFIASQLEQYDILLATDGQQGWELARQHQPDLIVMDFMMPGMDGMEVSRKLRNHPPTSRIPIVMVTAHAGDAPRLEALRAGVNDFLTKPFSSIELQARIGNLLLSGTHERMLAESNRDLTQAMAQLRESEEQLVRAEKLSSLGRMSAGIVHEVNNPLNYAKTSIHLLKSYRDLLPKEEWEEYDDTIADLNDGIQRVIDIITDLRAFTRGDETTRHLLVLHKVVQNTRRLIGADLNATTFNCEVPEDLMLEGNDNQLCQAFINLIQNALLAIENVEDPTISIKASSVPGGGILMEFADNGFGISRENQAKIFDPFFTTRDVGEGMGLGLSLTMRIIEEHGGNINVESEPGNGTTFAIYFPPALDSSNLPSEPPVNLDEIEKTIS